MHAEPLVDQPRRKLAALARAAHGAIAARLAGYASQNAGEPPAASRQNEPQPECASVVSYLEACEAFRKAWYGSGMLARSRPDRIREVRAAMRAGAAADLAQLICDMAGPLHPGDPGRAGAGFTKSAGELAAAVIEALLPPVLAERVGRAGAADAGSASATPMLDAELLKRCVTHWIRCGRLPEDVPPCPGFDSATLISDFLLAQRGDVLAPAGEEAAALRLSVVAMTAPAIESLLVMSRVSETLLGVLESQWSPEGEAKRHEVLQQESAVARSADDDLVTERAFRNLQRGPAQPRCDAARP